MKHKSVSRHQLVVSWWLWVVSLGLSAVAFSAAAQGTVAQPAAVAAAANKAEPPKLVMLPPMKVGEATHKLLDIQARGLMASDKQYPMPVDVAERIYQRYLASFEHPIAENSSSALADLD